MRATWLFALVIVVPLAATAEAFKCKQPDGKVSFQDHPCEPGSTGTPMTVVDPSPPYDAAKASARANAPKTDKKPESSFADPFEKQREERKRAAECQNARSNLGVLKTQRPVYRYDNNGDKKYIEDADRQSAITTAQRRVDEACK